MLQVIARVPAKINLVLSVGPPRPDGFHELATVFHAVSLYDEIAASAASAAATDGVSVTLSGRYGERAPDDESNLAVRAAHALTRSGGQAGNLARAGMRAGIRLGVRKEIPVAAGLAGGSADAAGALLVCDQLWKLRLSDARLSATAASLGSDVPFSLRGGTAVGTGRGEQLRSVPVGGSLHWVLAVADGELSTPAVYRRLDELRAGRPVPEPAVPDEVVAALAAGDAPTLAGLLHNDLEEAALSLRPQLADTLAAGRDLGALAGLVSGSGPTCVFLARDADAAAALASGLAASGTCADAVAVVGPADVGS